MTDTVPSMGDSNGGGEWRPGRLVMETLEPPNRVAVAALAIVAPLMGVDAMVVMVGENAAAPVEGPCVKVEEWLEFRRIALVALPEMTGIKSSASAENASSMEVATAAVAAVIMEEPPV